MYSFTSADSTSIPLNEKTHAKPGSAPLSMEYELYNKFTVPYIAAIMYEPAKQGCGITFGNPFWADEELYPSSGNITQGADTDAFFLKKTYDKADDIKEIFDLLHGYWPQNPRELIASITDINLRGQWTGVKYKFTNLEKTLEGPPYHKNNSGNNQICQKVKVKFLGEIGGNIQLSATIGLKLLKSKTFTHKHSALANDVFESEFLEVCVPCQCEVKTKEK